VSQRQPDSDCFGIGRPVRPDEAQPFGGPPISRYDLLLATIPAVLLLGWTVAQFTSVPTWATLAAGALVALPLLADGLAVNPPR
jgi:hypothetical protein